MRRSDDEALALGLHNKPAFTSTNSDDAAFC